LNDLSETSTRRLHAATPALVAAIAGFLLFAITLRGGFAYDFNYMVAADHRLRDPSQWGQFWKTRYGEGVDNLYRPLTSMVLALQSWLYGFDHPWRFHLLSILLHAGVCALVAEFARRLIGWRAALIAGLLYAVHPIHVEVLSDIVGQAEMMCALGTLGAMVLFLRRPMTSLRAISIFFCFLLALLTKEQGMLLPLLLLVLWICIGPRTLGEKDHKAMQLLSVLLCFSLSAYIIIREDLLKLRFSWDRNFIEPATNPLILSQGMDRLLMPVILLGRYTQLLIFPWRLLPDYSGNAIGSVAHTNDPYLWIGFLSVMLWITICAIATHQKNRPLLFCLLALGVTYGLVGNIVSLIGTNLAERLMYLPSVFFLMIVAMGLAKLSTRWLAPIIALLIALGAWRSFTYAQIWNDRLNLYEYAVREQPGAIRMYSWLATEYLNGGQGDRAIATMQQAQQVMPQNAEVWCNSSAIAMRTGRFDLADQYLSHAESIQVSMRTISLRQDLSARQAATQPAKGS
jgi:protein O-mannosyl-transferase